MFGAVGKDQDVAAAPVSVGNVGADLLVPLRVGRYPAKNHLYGGPFIDIGVRESVVNDEVAPHHDRGGWVGAHGVADWPELHVQDCFQAVTTPWGGGQADPAPVGGLADRLLEAHRRQVVAFIDDDQPVARKHLARVVSASQGLRSRQVDDATGAGPAGTELADLASSQPQELTEALPPLLGQRFGVNQDQGRGGDPSDQTTRHHRLSRAGRRHENSYFVGSQSSHRHLLAGAELPGEREVPDRGGRPPIVDLQMATRGLEESLRRRRQDHAEGRDGRGPRRSGGSSGGCSTWRDAAAGGGGTPGCELNPNA